MSRCFLDSNILIYAFADGERRQSKALDLLGAGSVISVQCLNEFASVASRKMRMDWSRVLASLASIRAVCSSILPLDLSLHEDGLRLAERYKLSVYDGMIVAAAIVGGCDTLYSEDTHAGLVVDDRLTIVNPFA